jgi:myo-inositol-1(or 4)-monophosphatase
MLTPTLVDDAVRAAAVGGAVVYAASRMRLGRPRSVAMKGAGDYVTETDLASERAIERTLAQTGIPIVGEERGGTQQDRYWVVDPLDGTTNFLHGFVAIGVSVALVSQGEPVIAAVYAPILNRTWFAWRGGGAWCEGESEPLRVSDRPAASAVLGTGFPFRRKQNLPRYLEAFRGAFERFEDLRRPGAAALDLAWVAEGIFDGFFELGLGTWDVAAGGLLIREAGGVVTDWTGDPDAWLSSGDVLAGPPAIHAALLDVADATRHSE